MPIEMPAISLAAVPGRRHQIIEFAQEAEARGFSGIYMPSLGDNMALATALATATSKIEFGTSICPIYFRAPLDLAQHAAFIHELSNGRFKFGIGVAHAPSHSRYGVTVGKPLSDIRDFVAEIRSAKMIGELPPIVLATLRKKMIGLSTQIAEGLVFANGARTGSGATTAERSIALCAPGAFGTSAPVASTFMWRLSCRPASRIAWSRARAASSWVSK